MAMVEEPRALLRQDDKEKLTGMVCYTVDIVLAGQLIAKFRNADRAHVPITWIVVWHP